MKDFIKKPMPTAYKLKVMEAAKRELANNKKPFTWGWAFLIPALVVAVIVMKPQEQKNLEIVEISGIEDVYEMDVIQNLEVLEEL